MLIFRSFSFNTCP